MCLVRPWLWLRRSAAAPVSNFNLITDTRPKHFEVVEIVE